MTLTDTLALEFANKYSMSPLTQTDLDNFKTNRGKVAALLTTTDGVDITEPAALHIVSKDWNICEIIKVSSKEQLDFDHRGAFSTREAAEAYILNHAPKLSLNDAKYVLDSIQFDRETTKSFILEVLTNAVKLKLK